MRNTNYYYCSTGHISTDTHVRFDKGMNNFPFDRTPLNSLELQGVKDTKPFLIELKEVDANKGKEKFFFLHLFDRMAEKNLENGEYAAKSRIEVYRCPYVEKNKSKSSAGHLFSSIGSTINIISKSFLVEITGRFIFSKTKTYAVLKNYIIRGYWNLY